MTTIFYVDMTAKTVEPFDCPSLPDGTHVMDFQPQIECTFLEGEYGLISGVATLLFGLYGFGIPLTLLLVLWNAKRKNLMADISFTSRYGWLCFYKFF